jgi:hypothetical protein
MYNRPEGDIYIIGKYNIYICKKPEGGKKHLANKPHVLEDES